MYIPPYLYYELKQLKEELTTQFTGDLNVPTALQNNPRCWKKQATSGEKQKKTIVLSDFRFEHVEESLKKQLKNTIDDLLTEGFTIYLWQSNGPLELTRNNSGIIHLDQTLQDCPPIHPKEITNVMAKKQTAAESLIVMNAKDLEILAQEMNEQKSLRKERKEVEEIYLDDIFKSKYSFEEIKQAIPNLQLTDRATNPSTHKKKSWWLKNHSEPVKIDYSYFNIYNKDTVDQFVNNASEIKTLELGNPKHSERYDDSITNDIQGKTKVSFKQLLEKGTHIDTIKVYDLNMIDFYFDLDEKSVLKTIEILDLSAVDDKSLKKDENYTRLINFAKSSMPNLKKILIEKNVFEETNYLTIDNDEIKKLNETLTQTNTILPTKHLISLIRDDNEALAEIISVVKRMPQLNTLLLNEVPTFPTDLKLSSLRNILINARKPPPPTTKTMRHLFRFAPHLDALDLLGFNNFSFMNELSCQSLTKLNFSNFSLVQFDIFLNLLTSLPNFAPNLFSLAVDMSLSQLTQNLPSSLPPLLHLQQITITKLPPSALKAILGIAPNLETLKLLKADPGVLLFTKNKHIRNLWAVLPPNSSCSLGSLLHQLPDLESLTLSSLPVEENDPFYSPQDLPKTLKLKKLDMRNFANPFLLYLILLRSPNLTELNLDGFLDCDKLLEKLVNSGATFPQLKTVSLAKSDLSSASYPLLKLIAPHLTTVDISESNISEVPEESGIFVDKGESRETEAHLPPPPQSKNENRPTHKIDADTALKNTKYNIPRVFSDLFGNTKPLVNYYRNSIYNTLTFTQDPTHPFHLSNQDDLQLEPYQNYTYGANQLEDLFTREKKNPACSLLLGQHEMNLSDQWSALPSASAKEILKAIHINGFERNEIEIQYSQRDNLYYIRKTSPGTVLAKIDYIIDPNPYITHNPQMQDIVNYFNNFGSGKFDTQNLIGEELLNRMMSLRIGRCEQRAIMFKHFVQKQYPHVPIRIVCNDCHSFVEIMQNGEWFGYCLGGYPASIIVKEPVSTLLGKTEAMTVKPLPQVPPKTHANELLAPPHPHHITWQQKGEAQIHADKLTLQALAATKIDSKTGERLGENVLIQCESDSDVQTMSLNLQQVAKHIGRPVFVIDDPAQITCQSRWLQRNDDNTGVSMKGPGGPLHAFLTEKRSPEDPPPVLVVNWNNFTADELVRFNTLIDENRLADGTPLPKNMVVVGLYDTKKGDAYTGSDFHSRQSVKFNVDPNTIPHDRFDFSISQAPKAVADAVEIELYDSVNWKYILLGQWTLEAGKIIFKEGPLTQALKQGKAVHLRNAPWDLPEFKQFWQQAKINKSIIVEGQILPIPKSFWAQLNQGSGYDWEPLTQDVQFLENLDPAHPPHVVNAGNFKHWVDHYDIYEGKPFAAQSLFANYQNQRVDLLITSPLNAASWHQLLKEANRRNIKLHLALPEGLELPSSLTKAKTVTYLKEKAQSAKHVRMISTTDVSMSLAGLKSELAAEKPLVIDISECKESDLLYRATPNFKEDNIQFNESWSDIFKALQNKQTVILKGHFSPEMINALLPLSVQGGMTVNGKFHPFEGKLILLSDQVLSSAIIAEQRTHALREKIDWVLANTPNLTSNVREAIIEHSWPENFSLAQIQGAVLHYLRSAAPRNFDLHEGILKVASTPEPVLTLDLSEQHVNEVCEKFANERMSALMDILSYEPFAFIGGKTGVGKSTFMSNYITPYNGFALYNEMTSLEEWASDESPDTIKVLFLDEANIANKDYTLFEGLYEVPPRILVNGNLIKLTPNHKVVLAGNPMSYGGERHLPRLLAEHGNACQFNPLPVEYIYRKILKPIFTAAIIPEKQGLEFSQAILRTYQYICANSEEEILISPRELKMMAMMIVSSTAKAQENASIIYEVAKQCLPDEKKAAFSEWFHFEFPKVLTRGQFVPPGRVSTSGKKFILTSSRKPIYQSLVRLLNVRELAQQKIHKDLQSPGLGGMLLEGEPGSGKSHFIIDALAQQGYEPISLDQVDAKKEPPSKGFYVIPASLAYSEKKRILLAAFDQGVPVVIDEINSGPMMEQLLNALLMGFNPDTKKGPANPGFLLLATQNPISMVGRQATSRAILRRMLFHECPAYTENEMKMILTELFPTVTPTSIDEEVKNHLHAVKYAKVHHHEPVPVFRDLYHIIKGMDHSHQAKNQLAKSVQKPPLREVNPSVIPEEKMPLKRAKSFTLSTQRKKEKIVQQNQEIAKKHKRPKEI